MLIALSLTVCSTGMFFNPTTITLLYSPRRKLKLEKLPVAHLLKKLADIFALTLINSQLTLSFVSPARNVFRSVVSDM
jgi:hypothetical protein